MIAVIAPWLFSAVLVLMIKNNTVILVALEQELPKSYLPGWNVIYSGVGKVNASLAISKSYFDYKPKYFVNYGTAGSLKKNISGLIEVSKFYQRDMDVRGLGFELGQTPFEDNLFIETHKNGHSCGTGDSFVMTSPELITDIVDMEAYSYAKFCDKNTLNLLCFKFISDNADDDAGKDWSAVLKQGARDFSKYFQRKYEGIQ